MAKQLGVQTSIPLAGSKLSVTPPLGGLTLILPFVCTCIQVHTSTYMHSQTYRTHT